MRLANGIIIDKEKTFGILKFSALRREVHVQNEDGTVSRGNQRAHLRFEVQRTGAHDTGIHSGKRAFKRV